MRRNLDLILNYEGIGDKEGIIVRYISNEIEETEDNANFEKYGNGEEKLAILILKYQ